MTVVTPLKPRQNDLWHTRTTKTLKVYMFFKTGRHFVRREFILYTWDSLVADIGGYLGLLLGHSLLSLFHSVTRALQKSQ